MPHRGSGGNRFCGKGAHFENGGCTPNRCPRGSTSTKIPGPASPPDTGHPSGQATWGSRFEGKNEKLGCPAGEQLVVGGAQAACVPLQQTCGRDEVLNGAACQKSAQCPTGSSYDAERASVREVHQLGRGPGLYGRFAYPGSARSGPDGSAKGSLAAFVSLQRTAGVRGSRRGLAAGQNRGPVQAPGGEISKASVTTIALVNPGGQPVATKGRSEVAQAAQNTLSSLVAGGGKAERARERHDRHLPRRELLGAHCGDGLGRRIAALTLLPQISRYQIDLRSRHTATQSDRTGDAAYERSETGQAWRFDLLTWAK